MVRIDYGQNVHQTGLPDDPAFDISAGEWNGPPEIQGFQRYATQGILTLSTGSATVTDTHTVLAAESGTADDVDNLLLGDSLAEDLIRITADVGDTITIRDQQGGVGQFHTNTGTSIVLTEFDTVTFRRVGNDWYQDGIAGEIFTWSADHSAAGNNLTNMGVLSFDDADTSLQQSGSNLQIDVATGGVIDLRINNVTNYSFNNVALDILNRQIQNVAILWFDNSNTSLQQTVDDLEFDVATGGNHDFRINNVSEYVFNATQSDFIGNNLVNMGILSFDDTDTSIQQSTSSLEFDVATGGSHILRVNDITEYTFDATEADWLGNNIINIGYFESDATNPAQSGVVRLGNTEAIVWRNNANDADITLTLDVADIFQFTSDISLVATDRIYLDGGTDTFIREQSADSVQVVVGGFVGITAEEISNDVDVAIGKLAVQATNAGSGFLNLNSMAGTPTSTPTAFLGKVALTYDTTNDLLYAYNGSWKTISGGGGGESVSALRARVASTGDIDLAVAADPNPIDGVTLANNEIILLKDQSTGAENGLYQAVTATDPTTWVRTAGYNQDLEVSAGDLIVVSEGTLGSNVIYQLTTNEPITLDTTTLTFTASGGEALDQVRTITFDIAGQTITNSTAGLFIDLPTSDRLEIQINDVQEYQFDSTQLNMTNNNLSMGTGVIEFNTSAQSIQQDGANGMQYDAVLGGGHAFRINDTTEYLFNDTSADFTGANILNLGYLELNDVTPPVATLDYIANDATTMYLNRGGAGESIQLRMNGNSEYNFSGGAPGNANWNGNNIINVGYFESNHATPAASGIIRLGNAETIAWDNIGAGVTSLSVEGADEITIKHNGANTYEFAVDQLDMRGQRMVNVAYIETNTANGAVSGFMRMAVTDDIAWRNNANNADLLLSVNGSDQLTWDGVVISSGGSGGGNFKARIASTANINLASVSDPNPIDGITLSDGERILLKNQTATAENGIYDAVTATDPTTWVRSADYNQNVEVSDGDIIHIQEGTIGADTSFRLTTDGNILLDTTALTFTPNIRSGRGNFTDWLELTQDGIAASVGGIRFVKTERIGWRNDANNNNNSIGFDAVADELNFAFNAVAEYEFSATRADFNNNNLVMGTGIIEFTSSERIISVDGGGNFEYDLAIGGEHRFRMNNVEEFTMSTSAFRMNGNNLTDFNIMSQTGTIASFGGIRFQNDQFIGFRNSGNTDNVIIGYDLNDDVVIRSNDDTTTLVLEANHTTPADGQVIGQLQFIDDDNNGTPQRTIYGEIRTLIETPIDTIEDGEMIFSVMKGGTLTDYIVLNENDVGLIFPKVGIRMGTNAIEFAQAGENIVVEVGDMIFNVTTADDFEFRIATAQEYLFNATSADWTNNNLINVNNFDQTNSAGSLTRDFVIDTAVADDTVIGSIRFRAQDEGPATATFAKIVGVMESDAASSEDGSLQISVMENNVADVLYMSFNDASGQSVDIFKNLLMQGNDIIFGATSGKIEWASGESIGIETTNMIFDVTTGDFFSFDINGTPEYVFDASQLDMNANILQDVNRIDFNQAGSLGAAGETYMVADANGITINVPTSDTVDFFFNGTLQYQVSSTSWNFLDSDIATTGILLFNSINESIGVEGGNTMVFDMPASEIFRFDIGGAAEYQFQDTGANWQSNNLTNVSTFNLSVSTLTIATGAVTAVKSYHLIAGESAADDDLDTINGGADGDIIVIKPSSDTVTITVTSAGNIETAGSNFVMDNANDTWVGIYDGTNWLEISRSNNGA